MRRALIPAFLLLLGSVVLGATVFRDDIARATGLAQNVNATIVSPLDQGNVKVHEQGTANVNVTNSSLPTTSPAATAFRSISIVADSGVIAVYNLPSAITASLITLEARDSSCFVQLFHGGTLLMQFDLTPGNTVVLPLNQPVTIDKVPVSCAGGGVVDFNAVGS